MASSKKYTFDFYKLVEYFWFLIFCSHNRRWWIAKHPTKLRRKED